MTATKTTSVVLAGVGGQGILLASAVVAKAAAFSGLDVKTNEVHGMAQRGGSVLAQIRFGARVYSPLVARGTADALGALEALEGLRMMDYLAPGGLAVVSTQRIMPITVSTEGAVYPEDITERLSSAFPRLALLDAAGIALKLGNLRAANVAVLGALSTGLELPLENWHRALEASVRPQFVELNLQAFAEGRKIG